MINKDSDLDSYLTQPFINGVTLGKLPPFSCNTVIF